jgi:hypothetical protein
MLHQTHAQKDKFDSVFHKQLYQDKNDWKMRYEATLREITDALNVSKNVVLSACLNSNTITEFCDYIIHKSNNDQSRATASRTIQNKFHMPYFEFITNMRFEDIYNTVIVEKKFTIELLSQRFKLSGSASLTIYLNDVLGQHYKRFFFYAMPVNKFLVELKHYRTGIRKRAVGIQEALLKDNCEEVLLNRYGVSYDYLCQTIDAIDMERLKAFLCNIACDLRFECVDKTMFRNLLNQLLELKTPSPTKKRALAAAPHPSESKTQRVEPQLEQQQPTQLTTFHYNDEYGMLFFNDTSTAPGNFVVDISQEEFDSLVNHLKTSI